MVIETLVSLAPRQDRSRKSLRSLLDASEEVISEVGFEKASVSAICRRAGLTSGAFYSRFASKREVISLLIERFAAEAQAVIDSVEVPPPSVQTTVRQFVFGLVDFYRRRRALVRALAACVHSDPEGAASMREIHGATIEYLTELLVARESDFSVPQPHLSARFGVIVAMETAMEMVVERRLVPDGLSEAPAITDEQLIEELSQMLDAYFTKS